MQTFALYIAIFLPIGVAILLLFILSGKSFSAAEERAHARRLVDAKMNARLLRFNL